MASPFDPRSLLLARHAQHVALIHFPIALFLVGVLLDLIGRRRNDARLATAAKVNLAAAAICIVPAYVSGILAWQLALDGQRLHGTLLYHLLFASMAAALIFATYWLHSRTRSRMVLVVIELAGVASVSLAAHLGGFLSGVNTN